MSIYNGRAPDQSLYDKYNSFIFSQDRHIFFKMVKRIELFEKIKYLRGDIVECGVFKGSGMMVWLKLLDMNTPHDIRKVIGFDFFDPGFVNEIADEKDRNAMEQVFTRCTNPDVSQESISKRFAEAGIPSHKYELIKGDICVTSKDYMDSHPGTRISLLYMDLDLDNPTYQALVNMWDRVVVGGVVVFDEYGYGAWSESDAVDRFVQENSLVLHKIDLQSPTAYLIKGELYTSYCPTSGC